MLVNMSQVGFWFLLVISGTCSWKLGRLQSTLACFSCFSLLACVEIVCEICLTTVKTVLPCFMPRWNPTLAYQSLLYQHACVLRAFVSQRAELQGGTKEQENKKEDWREKVLNHVNDVDLQVSCGVRGQGSVVCSQIIINKTQSLEPLFLVNPKTFVEETHQIKWLKLNLKSQTGSTEDRVWQN